MKKAVPLLLCVLLLLPGALCALAGSGVTYYIDSVSGSDSNSGLTEGSALASASPLYGKTFSAGDSILFRRGGSYDLEFALLGSGTEDEPINIGAYGDESSALPLLTTSGTGCVLTLHDVSYWTVSDLDITAPDGTGVLVDFAQTVVTGITLKGLSIHNVRDTASKTYLAQKNAPLRLQGKAETDGACLDGVTVDGCEVYDSGYGINLSGNSENTAEKPRNRNVTIENCHIHDTIDDGLLMMDTSGLEVNNCAVIRCSMSTLYYTAPCWFTRADHAVMENCEVAGSENWMDGMSVDFDDNTSNATVQYLYSHDNVHFFWSCLWTTDQHDNTIRYCLSVNDDETDNGASRSGTYLSKGFMFYNNTIINSKQIKFYDYDNAHIQNNIFIMQDGRMSNSTPPWAINTRRPTISTTTASSRRPIRSRITATRSSPAPTRTIKTPSLWPRTRLSSAPEPRSATTWAAATSTAAH